MSGDLFFSGQNGGRKTTPDRVQLSEAALKVAIPSNALLNKVQNSPPSQDDALIQKAEDLVLNFCQTVVMEEQKIAGQKTPKDKAP